MPFTLTFHPLLSQRGNLLNIGSSHINMNVRVQQLQGAARKAAEYQVKLEAMDAQLQQVRQAPRRHISVTFLYGVVCVVCVCVCVCDLVTAPTFCKHKQTT